MLAELWELWALVGIFLWTLGFIRVDFEYKKGSVRPPAWLYVLCGQPRTQKLPRGIMAVQALMAQLEGLLFLAGALVAYLAPRIEFLVQTCVLFVGTVVIYVAVFRFYKKYPYKMD